MPDSRGAAQLLPQYFGVLPEYRGVSLGRLLWRAAMHWGQQHQATYQLLQTQSAAHRTACASQKDLPTSVWSAQPRSELRRHTRGGPVTEGMAGVPRHLARDPGLERPTQPHRSRADCAGVKGDRGMPQRAAGADSSHQITLPSGLCVG
jgi:hypothetical protein